jgi:hypothetical protein
MGTRPTLYLNLNTTANVSFDSSNMEHNADITVDPVMERDVSTTYWYA